MNNTALKCFSQLLTLFGLLSLMAGCASVPPASNQAKMQATSFTPPPQMAGIYLFRPSAMMGAAVLWPICLDGSTVGEVADKSYLYTHAAPGNHNVQFFGDRKGASFTAEAGKNYCFIIHPFSVKPLTEAEAKKYADQYTLSGLCGPEWAANYVVAQGGQATYVNANGILVMPVAPVNTGVYYSTPTMHYTGSGMAGIQAGLMNNLGHH